MDNIILRGFLRKYVNTSPHPEKPVRIEKIFEPVWNYLSDSEKRSLGKHFHRAVVEQKIPGIIFVRKNAAGRAYYKILR